MKYSPCEGERCGHYRGPLAHRRSTAVFLSVPGRSSEPDKHPGGLLSPPFVRPVQPRSRALAASLRTPTDLPASWPKGSADPAGLATAPGSAPMTPHEAPSGEPGCELRSTASTASQAGCNIYLVARYRMLCPATYGSRRSLLILRRDPLVRDAPLRGAPHHEGRDRRTRASSP